MFQLFNTQATIQGSITKPPGDEFFYRNSEIVLDNIISYYQDRVFGLQNQHILVRLLESATLPYSYSWERFAEVVEVRSPYIAKAFRFTSSINRGTWFDGAFYGEDIREYILMEETSVYPYEIQREWKNVKPVKVLCHPISDFGLQIPTGQKKDTAEGLAIISINLPMLFYQYRGFLEDQKERQEAGSLQLLSTAHFVRKWVLPKMLVTHFDWVMLNRLMNTFYNQPMSQALTKHALAVNDLTIQFDKTFLPLLKTLKDTRKMYAHTLMSLPSIDYDNLQQALVWPDVTPTNNIQWLLMLSRLRVMEFIIDLQGKNGRQANTTLLNQARIELSKQLNGSIPLMAVNPIDLLAFQSMLDTINEKV